MNELFGCDLLSGNEIHQCVKENRVGLSPPHCGPPTRIPDDHFQMLAQVFRRVFLWIKPITIQINSIDQNRDP